MHMNTSIFGLLAILVMAAIGLALFAFWIWMLIHAITNKGLTDTEKIIWVLVVLFLHFLGALIYFFVGRPKATG
jgi:hypothetical protein